MDKFKCPVCKGEQAHIKINILKNGEKKETDFIFDIRNPILNSRVVTKACKNCHALSAWWEDIDTSEFISQDEKDKMKTVLGDKNETV